MTLKDSPTLQAEIDRCVMCGMCSQFCPTYRLTLDENESPRGRIALISALEKGQLAINDRLTAHLEHCTYCRACESYCPSGVRFGTIMDQARTRLTRQHAQPRHEQTMQNILARPDKTRQLGRWLERYQRWGLQRLMRASGLLSYTRLAQSDKLLPPIEDIPAQPEYSPALNNHRGDVALFTGCVTNMVDRQTLDASRRLLNVLGYGVYTPSGQTCCGALHQHSGRPEQASELASANMAAFDALDIEAVIHTSTGCTAFLREYEQLPHGSEEQNSQASSFSRQVQDIIQFVLECPWPEDLTIKPLATRVLVHEPCSARNVLRLSGMAYRLLDRIPGIAVQPLPNNDQCCGASGSQLLTKSTFAERLRQDKLDNLAELTGEHEDVACTLACTLVTTNISCALHLAAGVRDQGISVEVLHPVALLMKQVDLGETCTPTHTSAKVPV